MAKNKVLVVDDEPSIAVLIEFNLKSAGYEVFCVYDGEAVFEAVQSFQPDVMVLDWMLPKMNGIEVCSKLRSQNNAMPVIMLSALQDLSDKIAGLDNGADDYMTKPFSPQELISRIKAILRRSEPASEQQSSVIVLGELEIFPDEREIKLQGKNITLTPKEFELLLYLCKHRGKVLSRKQLLQHVWDYHFLGDTRIVDVHVSHLRDKIEKDARKPDYIITIRNVGYKLAQPSGSGAPGMT